MTIWKRKNLVSFLFNFYQSFLDHFLLIFTNNFLAFSLLFLELIKSKSNHRQPEPGVPNQSNKQIHNKKNQKEKTTHNMNLNEIKYLFIDNILFIFAFLYFICLRKKMLDDNPFVMILLIIIAPFGHLLSCFLMVQNWRFCGKRVRKIFVFFAKKRNFLNFHWKLYEGTVLNIPRLSWIKSL